jgi:pyruvate dehydrogenase E2 component (dihydrolipoamide acetyltransferase)
MDVKLPKLGEGVDSGVVVSILVREGDQIAEGQTILELENEKAVAPIPSPVSGTVTQIYVKEGAQLSVGQSMLSVAPAGAIPTAAKAIPPEPGPEATPERGPTIPSTPARSAAIVEPEFAEPATPAALPPPAAPSIRKLARDLGIDLTRVRGSELGGRIVLADLRTYVQRLQTLVFQAKLATPAVPTAAPPPPESIDFSKWGPIEKRPMSQIRRVISQRMAENWRTIPHVTHFEEADVTGMLDLKRKYNDAYEAKGARLTVTSFLFRAVAATLRKFPLLNASLDEAAHAIVLKNYVHLGVAVDTEAGLIVAVLRDADRKNLLALSQELAELSDKARDRRLSPEEMKGGTFTISNLGGLGATHFAPIINKPEAAVLGVGRGLLKPVVRDGQVVPRVMLPLAVSYDHRIIDGAETARFMVGLIQALEQFKEEEVKL